MLFTESIFYKLPVKQVIINMKDLDFIFSEIEKEFDIEAGLLEKDYDDFINQLKNFSLIEGI